MIILTVGKVPQTLHYAKDMAGQLTTPDNQWTKPFPIAEPRYIIDTDFRDESLAKKVRDAKIKKYNILCYISKRTWMEGTLDLDSTEQPDQVRTLDILNTVKLGTKSPVKGVFTTTFRKVLGVKLDSLRTRKVMDLLRQNYL